MKELMSRLIALSMVMCTAQQIIAQTELKYNVAETPWEAGFGNHRAIVEVPKNADAVKLDFNWRRHDKNPAERRLLIVNAKTGDTISNIHRLIVNNETCKLVFGPVEKGSYYFYYLPFKPDKEWGFYRYGYLKKEDIPSKHWMEENKLEQSKKLKKLPKAICTEIQARTDFDSFYPMEVIATQAEEEQLTNSTTSNYIAIAEDRKYPIKMRDYLPLKWIKEDVTHHFEGKALKNEYYAFQIGIYAAKTDLENVSLEFHDLKSSNNSVIPASAFTCFNTHGVDPYGTPFIKQVNVNKGKIQPLWIGTDILATTKSGAYKGHVTIKADNQPDKTIAIILHVSEETIADRGDNEPWRHSRLRWLNSTIGLDNEPTKPYTPITLIEENKLGLYGKQVALNEQGLPSAINVWDTEILNNPIRYVLEGDSLVSSNVHQTNIDSGIFERSVSAHSENFEIQTTNTIEFDGHLTYKIKLTAKEDSELKDFKLEIPFQSSIAEYMMGMGLPGTSVPQNHSAKWKGPHDSFWVGNTYGGLHVELRGGSYHGPLLNLYKPEPPESWHNGGKGGFSIEKGDNETTARIYSGQRNFKKGETLVFELSFLITPVRQIDTKAQFDNRYYHNGLDPMPKDDEITDGVKIVNLHHASKYNPYINYPFVATKEMKSFVDQMHAKDLKVKIYYTIRELTNYTTEIWALRSLGNEILGTGKGGGYPWLQEHLVDDYRWQWYSPLENGIDASIVNAPGDSRWYNYYLEGLAWLVKHIDIDGLYLDDVSYDRRILKRMRKILDRTKPGCMMDLHSNTGFSKGPATQYTEFFPYLDKLWFGESFRYDEMPAENWLVEVSGIPFGHMGDMLHAGGNPWRGMVYGMTVRYPWFTDGVTCDPRQIWKVWDSFGIADSKMIGYWEKQPVVSTSNPAVKATAYVKEDKMLIAVASWAKEAVNVKLNIDWQAVGIDMSKVKVKAPKIENFQPEQLFSVDDDLTIDPTKGWLLVVE
ncbi:glycoside hydrolase domain-containing protein [Aestuariivivens marinum]|uniref:glycoside hydrolase domain-containing protein n=1 Tax=Aestuariivivens marinum TaxID=2913555 RepID=UPI001F59C3D7|nr:glycoside hydrolase domain-containing protein [Aestuariivivens marinum]